MDDVCCCCVRLRSRGWAAVNPHRFIPCSSAIRIYYVWGDPPRSSLYHMCMYVAGGPPRRSLRLSLVMGYRVLQSDEVVIGKQPCVSEFADSLFTLLPKTWRHRELHRLPLLLPRLIILLPRLVFSPTCFNRRISRGRGV